MIFVCVGSREYQFNRLLKKLDELVQAGVITDEVIGQIGGSEYEPQNYKWHRFMDRDEFQRCREGADLIISHGGTGALIGALKLGKQVIAVPRLAQFGEHIDDHQTQITGVLAGEGYLREVRDMDELGAVILQCQTDPITKRYNRPSNILQIIEDFIEGKDVLCASGKGGD